MRVTLILLTVFLSSACVTPQGSYCAVYQPLNMNRPAAAALVAADRQAAEAAVVNEETYGECK